MQLWQVFQFQVYFHRIKLMKNFTLMVQLSENVPITPLLKYNSRIVAIDFFYNETLVKKLPRTLIESKVLSFTLMVTQKSRKFEFDNNIFLFSPKKQGNFSMVEFYKC